MSIDLEHYIKGGHTYSLLHWERHQIAHSNLNLFGLFSMKGDRDNRGHETKNLDLQLESLLYSHNVKFIQCSGAPQGLPAHVCVPNVCVSERVCLLCVCFCVMSMCASLTRTLKNKCTPQFV